MTPATEHVTTTCHGILKILNDCISEAVTQRPRLARKLGRDRVMPLIKLFQYQYQDSYRFEK